MGSLLDGMLEDTRLVPVKDDSDVDVSDVDVSVDMAGFVVDVIMTSVETTPLKMDSTVNS